MLNKGGTCHKGVHIQGEKHTRSKVWKYPFADSWGTLVFKEGYLKQESTHRSKAHTYTGQAPQQGCGLQLQGQTDLADTLEHLPGDRQPRRGH